MIRPWTYSDWSGKRCLVGSSEEFSSTLLVSLPFTRRAIIIPLKRRATEGEHPMPKMLLGSLAALAGVVAAIIATAPDADAEPGKCEQVQPCDPLTFILGEPPVQPSMADDWTDLMFPPGAR